MLLRLRSSLMSLNSSSLPSRYEGDLDFVAFGDVDFAGVVTELFDRHDAFGLQAGVDHHHVAADFHDDAGDDGARLQLGQVLLALFEQFGK